jgi:hypothetical protein
VRNSIDFPTENFLPSDLSEEGVGNIRWGSSEKAGLRRIGQTGILSSDMKSADAALCRLSTSGRNSNEGCGERKEILNLDEAPLVA